MKIIKRVLPLCVLLLALIFAVSIIFSHKSTACELSGYVLYLKRGWSVTSSPDTAGSSLSNAAGEQAATIEVVQTDGYGDSLTGIEENYFGQHEEFLTEEPIPLSTNEGSMTKVTVQWNPSAAQEESGEADYPPEIHYIIQFQDSKFIDVRVTNQDACSDVEEMLKTIAAQQEIKEG